MLGKVHLQSPHTMKTILKTIVHINNAQWTKYFIIEFQAVKFYWFLILSSQLNYFWLQMFQWKWFKLWQWFVHITVYFYASNSHK